jgi:PilZ domain
MQLERRNHPRMKLPNLSCIRIEPDNGGVVLNLSENGLSFQAMAPLQVGPMRFCFLCPPDGRIEATGHLLWTDETSRMGGLRFIDPTEDVKKLVSNLLAESSPEPYAYRETDDLANPILDKLRTSVFQPLHFRAFVKGTVIFLLAIVIVFMLNAYRRRGGEPQPLPPGPTQTSTSSFPTSDASTAGHSITGSASAVSANKPVDKVGGPGSQILSSVDPSQSELAIAQQYLNGTNVARNSKGAVPLLWAAIKKGNTTAEVMLADLYVTGDGVEKNCEQARVLLLAAAKKGNATASKKLQGALKNSC